MNRNVIGIGAGNERRGLRPVEVLLGVTAAVAVAGAVVMAARAPASAPESDQALKRTRAQAKMLDDLFKVAVVDIINRYAGPPAAKVAKTIFAATRPAGTRSEVDPAGSGPGKRFDSRPGRVPSESETLRFDNPQ
jgi:hypothetical protein